MPEIYTPDKFPGIKWSQFTIHRDGDPESHHGIVQVTTGDRDYKLNHKHELVVTELQTPIIHSRVRFGRPGSSSFTYRSNRLRPFDLDDPARINESSDAVSGAITTLHQIEYANEVGLTGEALLRVLRAGVGIASEKNLQDIGVLNEILANYQKRASKENLLENAKRARSLDVAVFYEGLSITPPGIQWNVEALIESFETGDFSHPQEIAKYIV